MAIISMAKEYKVRPSEIIYLDDPYVAFCFDEACYFILDQWDHEKNDWKTRPRWKDGPKQNNNSEFINSIMKNKKRG